MRMILPKLHRGLLGSLKHGPAGNDLQHPAMNSEGPGGTAWSFVSGQSIYWIPRGVQVSCF